MDLSLDLEPNSPTYGDLLTIDGDLVLTSDVDPRGTHPILQSVHQRLRLNLGEWFLNTRLGVPYIQQILRKRPDYAQNETLLRQVILETPGVLSILAFTTTYTPDKRLASISFRAETTQGTIAYASPTNTPTEQVTQ